MKTVFQDFKSHLVLESKNK